MFIFSNSSSNKFIGVLMGGGGRGEKKREGKGKKSVLMLSASYFE